MDIEHGRRNNRLLVCQVSVEWVVREVFCDGKLWCAKGLEANKRYRVCWSQLKRAAFLL